MASPSAPLPFARAARVLSLVPPDVFAAAGFAVPLRRGGDEDVLGSDRMTALAGLPAFGGLPASLLPIGMEF
jgi:hypothetical protein